MDKQILAIITDFNWDRVRETMLHLDWQWGVNDGVPSVIQLIKCAIEILTDVANGPVGASISTGGFKASKAETPYGDILRLEFVVEHWEA